MSLFSFSARKNSTKISTKISKKLVISAVAVLSFASITTLSLLAMNNSGPVKEAEAASYVVCGKNYNNYQEYLNAYYASLKGCTQQNSNQNQNQNRNSSSNNYNYNQNYNNSQANSLSASVRASRDGNLWLKPNHPAARDCIQNSFKYGYAYPSPKIWVVCRTLNASERQQFPNVNYMILPVGGQPGQCSAGYYLWDANYSQFPCARQRAQELDGQYGPTFVTINEIKY